MKQMLEFRVLVTVEDVNEPDDQPIRDALIQGLVRAADNDELTPFESATVVEGWTVRYVGTQPNPATGEGQEAGGLGVAETPKLRTPDSVEDAEAQVCSLYEARQEAEALEAEAERLWLASFVVRTFAAEPGLRAIVGEADEFADQPVYETHLEWVGEVPPPGEFMASTAAWIEEFYPNVAEAGWMDVLNITRSDVERAMFNAGVLAQFLRNGCCWPVQQTKGV